MNQPDRRCTHCGKPHLVGWTWLELDEGTGRYYRPGELPPGAVSQGLFPFGRACARAMLRT